MKELAFLWSDEVETAGVKLPPHDDFRTHLPRRLDYWLERYSDHL